MCLMSLSAVLTAQHTPVIDWSTSTSNITVMSDYSNIGGHRS